MKVHIGKYVKWVGPYQIADLLMYVGVDKDTCFKIGDKLSETWVSDLCSWIYEKRSRKIKVKIHNYDVWSMDTTLAYVVIPMLHELKNDKQGGPIVDSEDVPEELRPTESEVEALKFNGETDDKFYDRWEYVLDEMIFAFNSKINDWESEFYTGESDIKSVPVDKDLEETDRENASLHMLVDGPNHTLKIDYEGMHKYQDRITNGFRLFGKYYEALWT